MRVAYPLTLTFKFLTISSFIRVVDASGQLVSYVKQRAFRLKENVTIFADEQQTRPLYHMKANKIIDIGATYAISDADGRSIGALRQRGLRTFWKATYDILDDAGSAIGIVHEQNPWVKVIDGLIGEIPLVGFVIQQWINPTYLIDGVEGTTYLRLRKRPSLIERRFLLEQESPLPSRLEQLALPAVLMVVLLERGRG
ncbi:MAG TPA: hypothetical protein VGS01_07265 [Candidatus Limnocylindria bacterium]|jgi:hypothetical protein|nr:hypothetical protein [Candidatus Limnocylindria bacterium]